MFRCIEQEREHGLPSRARLVLVLVTSILMAYISSTTAVSLIQQARPAVPQHRGSCWQVLQTMHGEHSLWEGSELVSLVGMPIVLAAECLHPWWSRGRRSHRWLRHAVGLPALVLGLQGSEHYLPPALRIFQQKLKLAILCQSIKNTIPEDSGDKTWSFWLNPGSHDFHCGGTA